MAITGLQPNSTHAGQLLYDAGATQLSSYRTILASGEIVPGVMTPVPEPSTWAAAALALGAIVWTQRRRFKFALAKQGERAAS